MQLVGLRACGCRVAPAVDLELVTRQFGIVQLFEVFCRYCCLTATSSDMNSKARTGSSPEIQRRVFSPIVVPERNGAIYRDYRFTSPRAQLDCNRDEIECASSAPSRDSTAAFTRRPGERFIRPERTWKHRTTNKRGRIRLAPGTAQRDRHRPHRAAVLRVF